MRELLLRGAVLLLRLRIRALRVGEPVVEVEDAELGDVSTVPVRFSCRLRLMPVFCGQRTGRRGVFARAVFFSFSAIMPVPP